MQTATAVSFVGAPQAHPRLPALLMRCVIVPSACSWLLKFYRAVLLIEAISTGDVGPATPEAWSCTRQGSLESSSPSLSCSSLGFPTPYLSITLPPSPCFSSCFLSLSPTPIPGSLREHPLYRSLACRHSGFHMGRHTGLKAGTQTTRATGCLLPGRITNPTELDGNPSSLS